MIVALLSWWEEDPAWLIRCVAGVSTFAHHLVAVDGAYANMEGAYAAPRSSGVQADAVVATADGYGLGLTLYQPPAPWLGDQVAKRSFMFDLAGLTAGPGDWYFVVDADEIVVNVPADLDDQLDKAAKDGFEAAIVEQSDLPLRGLQPARRFFQYDPHLRCEGGHFRFVAGPHDNPRLVRGDERVEDIVPAANIRGFRFEHWSNLRNPHRREKQRAYYRRRHEEKLEA